MANLKTDLDSYLNSGSRTKSSPSGLSLANLSKSLNIPTLKSPFSSPSGDVELLMEDGDGQQSPNGWFSDTQKDCCPSLSKKQRIIGFIGCISMGLLNFALAAMYIPVLVLYARKFALLFSLGSLFCLGSFSLLWGPMNHMRHLLAKDRLPFTSVYLVTLFGTLYCALGLQSYVLTVLAATGQCAALVWFTVSYVPGGQTGIAFFTRMCSSFCKSTVSKALPI